VACAIGDLLILYEGSTMTIKESPEKDQDTSVRLRANGTDSANRLKLNSAQPKAANEAQGSDPYNTSGSFDRKKHWERVGKR
jgi:hypothetical protein